MKMTMQEVIDNIADRTLRTEIVIWFEDFKKAARVIMDDRFKSPDSPGRLSEDEYLRKLNEKDHLYYRLFGFLYGLEVCSRLTSKQHWEIVNELQKHFIVPESQKTKHSINLRRKKSWRANSIQGLDMRCQGNNRRIVRQKGYKKKGNERKWLNMS